MKDKDGNELEIGDKVTYVSAGSLYGLEFEIIEFAGATAKCRLTDHCGVSWGVPIGHVSTLTSQTMLLKEKKMGKFSEGDLLEVVNDDDWKGFRLTFTHYDGILVCGIADQSMHHVEEGGACGFTPDCIKLVSAAKLNKPTYEMWLVLSTEDEEMIELAQHSFPNIARFRSVYQGGRDKELVFDVFDIEKCARMVDNLTYRKKVTFVRL